MSHKVLIYYTPTCPYCHQAKAYLKEKGVEFTDYNVADDEKKAQEMMDKSGQLGVPVIDIDGTIIIGFDKEKMNQLLKI